MRQIGAVGWLAVITWALTLGPQTTLANEKAVARVGGTGIALAAMRALGDDLSATDSSIGVEVLPSLGTPGGLRALVDREIDIALAARALTPKELAMGLREAACFATALIFATSHRQPSGVTRAELPNIYLDAGRKWSDGTPMKVILRSRAGSENPYLIAAVPGMQAALDKAYARSGMPIGSTDQENADLALRIQGSFAVMTLLQLRAERLDLRIVPLDDILATVETVANNSYPFPMRICAILTASSSPVAARVVAHLHSASGQAVLRSLGSVFSK